MRSANAAAMRDLPMPASPETSTSWPSPNFARAQRRNSRSISSSRQLVLVSGEAGIGKSRIAAALAERIHTEPHLRLRYFCSPHHQGSALFPFVDQLGRAAGFARDDSPGSRIEKIETMLARTAAPDEDVALLANLLSLPASDRHPLPNLSPQ